MDVKEVSVLNKTKELGGLISVGPAMLRDFELLGIRSIPQLAKAEPEKLYRRLERLTGQPQDICVLDVFRAAVAQARNPRLPAEECQWWYWSRKRKDGAETQSAQRNRRVRVRG
jgi:nucleotidyltransferase/DNA polymerase involved in DNA repair